MPDLVPPMQVAAGAGQAPVGPDWVVELAWTGHRCIAYVEPGGRTRLLSSGNVSMTPAYPELLPELERRSPAGGMILDGTLVARGEEHAPRVARLQRRSARFRPTERQIRRVPVDLQVADLLWLDGHSLVDLPYRDRRNLLEGLGFAAAPVWTTSPMPISELPSLLQIAEAKGVEALHARHLGSRYRPGQRSPLWVRVPVPRIGRVLVGGWTPVDPRRPDRIASLLVGVPDGRGLRYVGRVGVSGEERRPVAGLRQLRRAESPFLGGVPAEVARDAIWVEPRVTGLVDYTGFTADGRLRLPHWRGTAGAGSAGIPWARRADPPDGDASRQAAGAPAGSAGASGGTASASAGASAQAGSRAAADPSAAVERREPSGHAAVAGGAADPAGASAAAGRAAAGRGRGEAGAPAAADLGGRSSAGGAAAAGSQTEPVAQGGAGRKATSDGNDAIGPIEGSVEVDDTAQSGGVTAVVETAGPGMQAAAAAAGDGAGTAVAGAAVGGVAATADAGAGSATAAEDTAGRASASSGPAAADEAAADEAAPEQAAEPVEARRLEQHFVYNSLNAIASLIRTDPARARELLVGFADLSRATDRPADAPSTLGHELTVVRDYLALEQARFGKRLRVEIDVDRALTTVPVEPLRVLAAVRDAVQRDIEPRAQGGVLSVTARPADGGCVVTVTGGAGEPKVLPLTAHVTV
jgi:bifunctional non-homologous end joining protein LigD